MKARGRPLTTVKGFIDRVEGFSLPDGHEFYFRGHSNKDKYQISPSVFRSGSGKAKEHALFRELIATNPGEFKDDSSTLERLARMQHHSCPTRLLDVSTNPLVALYFACKSNPKNHGEVIAFRVDKETVKFFDSDTVSCISNLSRLSLPDKQALMRLDETTFNDSTIAKRLLHFIKEEKPYFEPNIKKHDLSRVLVVRPKLNQHETSGVACVLEHGDARAIWLDRLNPGDKLADLALGRIPVLGQRAIADEYNHSVHTPPKKVGVVPNT